MNAIKNLSALNSATKYPSIETYHELGQKGRLTDTVTSFAGSVYLTEKIDGTNGRIVLLPGNDYVIGSREHLLYAKGDRIQNPVQEIVPTLKPLANLLASTGALGVKEGARALYLEVYGGNVGGQAKQYSTAGKLSYRLFDIAQIGGETLTWDPERISKWREGGGQDFSPVVELRSIAYEFGIPYVPYVGMVEDGRNMPQTIQDTYDFLSRTIPATQAPIDGTGKGFPEGLVFRSEGRSVIRKARFQDYRRTLGIK